VPHGARIPRGGQRQASLSGVLIVDSIHGQIRVRAWPKKRTGRRHPTNEYWTKWLKAATFLYRYQPAIVQAQLMEATKGTVWMPRDVFISAARGRAWLLQDNQGRVYYPMAFREEVSESLDAITQFAGSMLFRGPLLWQPIEPGSPGDILIYVDDDNSPLWSPPTDLVGTFKGARVNRTSAQSINNATTTPVSFDNERYDTDGFHSNSTNPTRFTIPTTGYYHCGGNVEWASNAVGQRELVITLNAAAPGIASSRIDAGAATTYKQNISTDWFFNAGDYIELAGRQTSGAALNINSVASQSAEFWIHRLGPVL